MPLATCLSRVEAVDAIIDEVLAVDTDVIIENARVSD